MPLTGELSQLKTFLGLAEERERERERESSHSSNNPQGQKSEGVKMIPTNFMVQSPF
jgi:hypothetical protein